ncbi:MAG: hypothetical protein WBK28_02575 [Minisyncoccia bacterium]
MSNYDLAELIQATSYSECLACVPTKSGYHRDPDSDELWGITRALRNLGLDPKAVDLAVEAEGNGYYLTHFARYNTCPTCIDTKEFISIVKTMLDAKA